MIAEKKYGCLHIEWPLGVKKDNGLEQDKCYHMNAQGDNYTCAYHCRQSRNENWMGKIRGEAC